MLLTAYATSMMIVMAAEAAEISGRLECISDMQFSCGFGACHSDEGLGAEPLRATVDFDKKLIRICVDAGHCPELPVEITKYVGLYRVADTGEADFAPAIMDIDESSLEFKYSAGSPSVVLLFFGKCRIQP